MKIEQLNIEGKRSGEGFVTHKARLINALTKALSDRVIVSNFTLGRKGFLNYLKAVSGSNVVKIVPASVSASDSQANSVKRLKVICGNNQGLLNDTEWITDKTENTICEVRVSPNNSIIPNIGTIELAEALNRVLPFTYKQTDKAENRPVLECILFKAENGKLKLVSADGFRLAIASIDYQGDGEALINRDDLNGISTAISKARRARLEFIRSKDLTARQDLAIDTESIRYKFLSVSGVYPTYQRLIPTDFKTVVHIDTSEVLKAVNSLKALTDGKDYPIDVVINDGKVTLSNTDAKGQANITGDGTGSGFIRFDGRYFNDALKAIEGMADFQLVNSYSPALFSADGYNVVLMGMISEKAKAEQQADKLEAENKLKAEIEAEQAKQAVNNPGNETAEQQVTAEAEQTEQVTAESETEQTEQPEQTDVKAESKHKGKRKDTALATV